MKEQRERIVAEFEKMGLFLVEEKQRLLQTLKDEEEETAVRLRESTAALQQQSHSLEMLLLQLEDRREREPLQMLQVRGAPACWQGGCGACVPAQVWSTCRNETSREGCVSASLGCVNKPHTLGLEPR